jgi:hypothetical protein
MTHAIPDATPAIINDLCRDLALSSSTLPGGASFITGLAIQGFVPTYAEFAIRGDSVWLLNPIIDGSLRAGLDTASWNAAVGGRYTIANDSVAKFYTRGVAALHTNWGPAPSPFCGRDSLVVEHSATGEYRVKDLLLLTSVSFRSDARVIGVRDLSCN